MLTALCIAAAGFVEEVGPQIFVSENLIFSLIFQFSSGCKYESHSNSSR